MGGEPGPLRSTRRAGASGKCECGAPVNEALTPPSRLERADYASSGGPIKTAPSVLSVKGTPVLLGFK
jgi:hypothetical protein